MVSFTIEQLDRRALVIVYPLAINNNRSRNEISLIPVNKLPTVVCGPYPVIPDEKSREYSTIHFFFLSINLHKKSETFSVIFFSFQFNLLHFKFISFDIIFYLPYRTQVIPKAKIPKYSIIILKANRRYVQWYKFNDFNSIVHRNKASINIEYTINWHSRMIGMTGKIEKKEEKKLRVISR